jgi:hypothetical protein
MLAAAALGAGIALLLAAAAVVIAVAYVYQGAHVAHDDRRPDPARCRQYHRLSPEERRIWRSGEHAAAAPAAAAGAVPFRGGEGASRDGTTGSWRPVHA